MIWIFIVVYVLSVLAMWKYINAAHSEGGIFQYAPLSGMDLMATFVPIINTLLAIFSWIFFFPKDSPTDVLKKFFRIK